MYTEWLRRGRVTGGRGEHLCWGVKGQGMVGSHVVCCWQRALQRTRSLRMQATRATLGGLPTEMCAGGAIGYARTTLTPCYALQIRALGQRLGRDDPALQRSPTTKE